METAYVMLAAGALSGLSVSLLAWKTSRIDPSHPNRLISELHLARWAAVLLAAVGAISMGLALGASDVAAGSADIAMGVVFVGVAGLVLQRDPRESLLFATGAFITHALVNLAHRPGWLSPDVVPHWYAVGCATYDVCIAGLCFWARKR